MGGQLSKPSNKRMVDQLVEHASYITTADVEGAFRAVDRAMYFDLEENEVIDPYAEDPWRRGNLHLSAPSIYARVVDELLLKPGLSFLNLGSGTGYLSTIVGLLIGPNGVNHGIEIHGEVIEFARDRLEKFKQKSHAIDKYDFSEPVFIQGNCLNFNPIIQYDRIYLGAACLPQLEDFMKKLVKPDGGILVMPFENHLMRYVRHGEALWYQHELMDVNFTLMIGRGDNDLVIDMPLIQPRSLKDLSRIKIRQGIRDKTNEIYPYLNGSDNIITQKNRRIEAERMRAKSKELYSTKKDLDPELRSKLDIKNKQFCKGNRVCRQRKCDCIHTFDVGNQGEPSSLRVTTPRNIAQSTNSSRESEHGLGPVLKPNALVEYDSSDSMEDESTDDSGEGDNYGKNNNGSRDTKVSEFSCARTRPITSPHLCRYRAPISDTNRPSRLPVLPRKLPWPLIQRRILRMFERPSTLDRAISTGYASRFSPRLNLSPVHPHNVSSNVDNDQISSRVSSQLTSNSSGTNSSSNENSRLSDRLSQRHSHHRLNPSQNRRPDEEDNDVDDEHSIPFLSERNDTNRGFFSEDKDMYRGRLLIATALSTTLSLAANQYSPQTRRVYSSGLQEAHSSRSLDPNQICLCYSKKTGDRKRKRLSSDSSATSLKYDQSNQHSLGVEDNSDNTRIRSEEGSERIDNRNSGERVDVDLRSRHDESLAKSHPRYHTGSRFKLCSRRGIRRTSDLCARRRCSCIIKHNTTHARLEPVSSATYSDKSRASEGLSISNSGSPPSESSVSSRTRAMTKQNQIQQNEGGEPSNSSSSGASSAIIPETPYAGRSFERRRRRCASERSCRVHRLRRLASRPVIVHTFSSSSSANSSDDDQDDGVQMRDDASFHFDQAQNEMAAAAILSANHNHSTDLSPDDLRPRKTCQKKRHDNECLKYHNLMSLHIRQLALPRELLRYLNYDRNS